MRRTSLRRPVPAGLAPAGLPGLDPAWSRLVQVTGADGAEHTWHVLDTGPASGPRGTLLCVHGNPTWSYLWRGLLAAAPTGWRVVAPDHLGMGFSERLLAARTLAERIADLGALTQALELTGPVVVVAHDWGGPISLGWALEHQSSLAGIVLTNTAVNQPADSSAPALIRTARLPLLRELVCVRTPAFVRGATAVSRPQPPGAVRRAFAAPYGTAARRAAVGEFVADIPLEHRHPSWAALQQVRDRLPELEQVPALILWGPLDPVFGRAHLRDLRERLPGAAVHLFEGASHLLMQDAPEAAEAVVRFVQSLDAPAPTAAVTAQAVQVRPVWAALQERATDPGVALVELASGRTVSALLLHRRVDELAAALRAYGVRPGERVAMLIEPGADLAAAVYACWRIGAVVVLADAGLGLASMGRALRSAAPAYVIAGARGLAAARVMRVPGRRIAVATDRLTARALGAETTLFDLIGLGRMTSEPLPPLDPDADAAVVFTSGATGPPKGVVYRHRQLRAQLDALQATYTLTSQDRLVAAFAPFVLYGPALGIASAVPDIDVTAPASLTAVKLADACAAVDATVVFAAPAALRNVVRTAAALGSQHRSALARIRLLVSAGAPVPAALLRELREVLPHAQMHTPYGMTEVLPVTDVSLRDIDEAGAGLGVCVGRPVAGVEVAISALDDAGVPADTLVKDPQTTGELCVRAAHVKDRYDNLWLTEQRAASLVGWHRTGDVGHLDDEGRVWVQGRLAHVITTAGGVVTPVGVEQAAESLDSVRAAAAVGVGPAGTQQLVVVVVPEPSTDLRLSTHNARPAGRRRTPLAPPGLSAQVRRAVGQPVAAVLVTNALPVDVRHQSKVDRRQVAAWAARVLRGDRSPHTGWGATP